MEACESGQHAVYKGAHHSSFNDLFHIGHTAKGVAIVLIHIGRVAAVQQAQYSAYLRHHRQFRPHPGRLVADLLLSQPEPPGGLSLIPQMMPYK